MRANTEFSVDLRLAHRGRNMVIVEAAEGPQEITLSNNRAAFAANGVRDRLRVLLITGEPHAGARVWRNLLKSDPAVDLVHFSILRPPDKQDFTPLNELALIPFPTEELFERRLNEFDLIIFDRAPQRGIQTGGKDSRQVARTDFGRPDLIPVAQPELAGQQQQQYQQHTKQQARGKMVVDRFDCSPISHGTMARSRQSRS